MEKNRSIDFLNIAFTRDLSREEFDELITLEEDSHLEFKGGCVFNDKKTLSKIVKEYVSGFANSTGGLLVIGVENKIELENKRPFSNIEWKGKDTLSERASRILAEMATVMFPPPCYQHINVGDDEKSKWVLIIAVHRTHSLVSVRRNNSNIYYMRNYDSTLPVEPWLIEDILLGRRNRPVLQLTSANLDVKIEKSGHSGAMQISVLVGFSNFSLVTAKHVRVGIVYPGKLPERNNKVRCGESLKTVQHYYREGVYDSDYKNLEPLLQFRKTEVEPIAVTVHSFDSARQEILLNYMQTPARQEQEYGAAIFIMADNAPPVWYQLQMTVQESNGTLTCVDGGTCTSVSPGVPELYIRQP